MKVKKSKMIHLAFLMLVVLLLSTVPVQAQEVANTEREYSTYVPFVYAKGSPEPQVIAPTDEVIEGIKIDWSTLEQQAQGSDNWPITWADDGHQYTSFGDGGGFGGTNQDGRVSLGVARIEGGSSNYKGINIWGGRDALNPAEFEGKSYGIISIDGVL
jgi:hypothetical protein